MKFCQIFAPTILRAVDRIVGSCLEFVADFLQGVNEAIRRFRNIDIEQHDVSSSLKAAAVCEAIEALRLENLSQNLRRHVGALLILSVYRSGKRPADFVPNVLIELLGRRVFLKKQISYNFGPSLTDDKANILLDLKDSEGERFTDPWTHLCKRRLWPVSKVKISEAGRVRAAAGSYMFRVRDHPGFFKRVFFLYARVVFHACSSPRCELGTYLSPIQPAPGLDRIHS